MPEINRGDLAALVINLRAVSQADSAVWRGVENGSLTLLSRDKAIESKVFAALEDHEKAFVRAYAVGLGAHRAVLTGFSGARMHGMWVAGHLRDPVELGSRKIPPRAQWNPGTVYRRLELSDDKILNVAGVRTPRLFRIFVEIARHHGFPDALVAADWLRREGMGREEMRREAALLGRMTGIGTVRDAIEHSVANSDSPFEPYARGTLIEAGLPVIAQAPLCDGAYRADLLIGDHTVVEIDGGVKYTGQFGRPDQVLLAEKRRENQIRNSGKSILRYSPADILRDPDRFIREVRADYERHLGWAS